MWEDQGIFHYMAWGTIHGLVPYRDTINMNWPGSIIVHLIAFAISGTNAVGLRLLDVGFLILLSTATAVLLRAYGVDFALRCACVTSYYATYFMTNMVGTAQRESFALPLVAVGVALCLIQARRGARFRRGLVFACGLISALGLSI